MCFAMDQVCHTFELLCWGLAECLAPLRLSQHDKLLQVMQTRPISARLGTGPFAGCTHVRHYHTDEPPATTELPTLQMSTRSAAGLSVCELAGQHSPVVEVPYDLPLWSAFSSDPHLCRHINGHPGEPPVRPNISLGDTLAGLHGALGAVMALLHRQRHLGHVPGQVCSALFAVREPSRSQTHSHGCSV